MTRDYGIRKRLALSVAEAVPRVKEALAAKGFGVLTEIDVRETLRKKLGVEFRDYRILGACNPGIAHRTLEAETEIGLLLPCNVIVYQDGDGCVVSAVDPVRMLEMVENPALSANAAEVRRLLEEAVASL